LLKTNVSETSVSIIRFDRRLIGQEDFNTFVRRESFGSYRIKDVYRFEEYSVQHVKAHDEKDKRSEQTSDVGSDSDH
jgi:hypothetical protein